MTGEIIADTRNYVVVKDRKQDLLYAIGREVYPKVADEAHDRASKIDWRNPKVDYPMVEALPLVEVQPGKFDFGAPAISISFDKIKLVLMTCGTC